MWHLTHRAPSDGAPSTVFLWKWWSRGVVDLGLVALKAQRVAVGVQLQRVAVVAVSAGDVASIHLGLQERAVDVDLVEDLAVGVVQPLAQQRRQIVVEQTLVGVVVVAELGTPAVTRRASLHELGAGEVGCPPRGRRWAGRAAPWRASRPRQRVPIRGRGRPRSRRRCRTRWCRRCRSRVVGLHQVGGVALGAHAVPVLAVAGPVQPVVRRDVRFRVEVVPLAALGVPGCAQGLQPPAREGHQVLLERLVAEGVAHLELAGLAAGPSVATQKPPPRRKKRHSTPWN
jgi:hypothetical protein